MDKGGCMKKKKVVGKKMPVANWICKKCGDIFPYHYEVMAVCSCGKRMILREII